MALVNMAFFSAALGQMTDVKVILPDIKPGAKKPYPTLWLLHGLGDDYSAWGRRTSIERYVKEMNLAVVMPDGGRSFYSDMRYGGKYWTYLSQELPRLMRHYFPLSDRREDNFAAGASMGAYGAYKLALRCPNAYCAAAGISGAYNVCTWPEEFADSQDYMDMYRLAYGDAQYCLDTGSDIMALLGDYPGMAHKPSLYAYCGKDDIFLDANYRLEARAKELNIPLTFKVGPGGHDWDVWDLWIQDVLQWLPLDK